MKEQVLANEEQLKQALKKDLACLQLLKTNIINTNIFWGIVYEVLINVIYFVPIRIGMIGPFNFEFLHKKRLLLFNDIMNSFIFTDKINKGVYSELDYSIYRLKSYIKRHPVPWDVELVDLRAIFVRVQTLVVLLRTRQESIRIIDLMIYDAELNLTNLTECVNSLNF